MTDNSNEYADIAERSVEVMRKLDPLSREVYAAGLIKELTAKGYIRPAKIVAAAMKKAEAQQAPEQDESFPEITPWKEPVNGSSLLEELSNWFGAYMYMEDFRLDTAALWTVVTWFRDEVERFAPLLTVTSPTSGCGKSNLLTLLQQVVKRPDLNNGTGITTAVLFRLNEQSHPTLLIDEGEKLSGRHGNQEMISLLNAGYIKGQKVRRMGGKDNDEIKEFDAFGFRAIASIRDLAPTLMDRALVIPLQKKPKSEKIEPFNSNAYVKEGAVLAQKIKRWTDDHREKFKSSQYDAPRPRWLKDRPCDNWRAAFTVAMLAGCTDMALNAARESSGNESQDLGAMLIADIQQVFEEENNPKWIGSVELCEKLNEIESSGWGEYKGSGMTPIKLSNLLKPFKVRPKQNKVKGSVNTNLKGYKLEVLQSVFDRYASEEAQGGIQNATTLQPNSHGGFDHIQHATEGKVGSGSEEAESLATTGLYRGSGSEGGKEGGLPLSSQEPEKSGINGGYSSLYDKHMAILKGEK